MNMEGERTVPTTRYRRQNLNWKELGTKTVTVQKNEINNMRIQ